MLGVTSCRLLVSAARSGAHTAVWLLDRHVLGFFSFYFFRLGGFKGEQAKDEETLSKHKYDTSRKKGVLSCRCWVTGVGVKVDVSGCLWFGGWLELGGVVAIHMLLYSGGGRKMVDRGLEETDENGESAGGNFRL